MNLEQEELLNECIKKKLNNQCGEQLIDFKMPLRFVDIKDNLQALQYCLLCLEENFETNSEGEMTVYGSKVEQVLTIVNTRIIELKTSQKSNFFKKVFKVNKNR